MMHIESISSVMEFSIHIITSIISYTLLLSEHINMRLSRLSLHCEKDGVQYPAI